MTTATAMNETQADLEAGVVHLEPAVDGIATLRLGAPSEPVVTLTERRLDSLKEVLLRAKDSGLRGLIVTGSGPGMFAAGVPGLLL